MNIGVIGLGKLGLPMACLLSQAHNVFGYDVNNTLVGQLRKGTYSTWEPNCDYRAVAVTTDLQWMLANTDLAFICVNTPTGDDGQMDLSQVRAACDEIANHATPGYSLAISSTVMPGTANNMSEMLSGAGVTVYSNPVWIALGNVIQDLRQPPILLIGADGAPHERLLDVWQPILHRTNLPSKNIHLTDTITAEFLKLAHNAWCTTKMSFLGYLQDHHPEVDIEAVSRFFQNGGERPGAFWKAGPAYGGACFPRDLAFWNGYTGHPIGKTTAAINQQRIEAVAAQIPEKSRVLILGSSYKYGVPVLEGSISSELGRLLGSKECTVWIADKATDFPTNNGWDWCIVAHKELACLAPENAKIINLW
jgi:UDPglucose 6-dehydrogenase